MAVCALADRSLKRNIEVNRIEERVTVIEAAIRAAAGTVRFTIGKDTTNRVAADADGATREVKLRTLDDILADEIPVLIKMDVEGYEPEVVAGASAVLTKSCLAAVITETADPAIRQVMENCGFVCATYFPFERSIVSHGSSGTSASSHNTLFVRPDQVRERLKTAAHRQVAGIDV